MPAWDGTGCREGAATGSPAGAGGAGGAKERSVEPAVFVSPPVWVGAGWLGPDTAQMTTSTSPRMLATARARRRQYTSSAGSIMR
jgi:hypothetical protein